MKLLKYIQKYFLSKAARDWWKSYITGSDIIKGLARFLVFCLILQGVFFAHPVYALLIIFGIATLSFVYAIVYMGRRILGFVLSELYPNDGLTAYFLIGVGGVTFGSLILVPALFALGTVAEAPVTWQSFLITYAYVLPVWSFFEVSRSVSRSIRLEAKLKQDAVHLESVKIHQQNQSEAIAELAPKTAQKINDLTAIKDLKKVAEKNGKIK